MSRPVIAVDIDDTVADTTEALRVYFNQATGMKLTKSDYVIPATYWGYYRHVWNAVGVSDHSYIEKFHAQFGVNQDNILPIAGAQAAIKRLHKKYDLVAITSRELFMEAETNRWVTTHFGDVFDEIVVLGHVKNSDITKGDACIALNAKWLIDDNVEHCESAADRGVQPILFGSYGWHHDLQSDLTQCKNWTEVEAYFDQQN